MRSRVLAARIESERLRGVPAAAVARRAAAAAHERVRIPHRRLEAVAVRAGRTGRSDGPPIAGVALRALLALWPGRSGLALGSLLAS